MNKINYKGQLHLDYHFYIKVMRLTKYEVGEKLKKVKIKLDTCDNESEKFELKKEYNLLLERYNELI